MDGWREGERERGREREKERKKERERETVSCCGSDPQNIKLLVYKANNLLPLLS